MLKNEIQNIKFKIINILLNKKIKLNLKYRIKIMKLKIMKTDM